MNKLKLTTLVSAIALAIVATISFSFPTSAAECTKVEANGKTTTTCYRDTNPIEFGACVGKGNKAEKVSAADSPSGKATEKCVASEGADIWGIVQIGINTVLVLTGILCTIFIIMAGIKYATSGGDEKKITSAKHTLTYAIIGLVIALLAGIIVNFVMGTVRN